METTDEQLAAEIKQLEEDLKNDNSSYGSPETKQKDSILTLFRDILHIKDTTRVGNLKDDEIGTTRLGMRAYKDLAVYAEVENLPLVSAYFHQKANNISETSMSRKGWFGNLMVTSIKKENKGGQTAEKKRGLFNWGSKKEVEEE